MVCKGDRVMVSVVEEGEMVQRQGYVVSDLNILGTELAHVHILGYPLPYLIPIDRVSKIKITEGVEL